jgi:alkanesulfonate monooxygenase SsuD/methylene tetrahydromethanopterin reductase-like flavin-dependent oxidoreductase (luciferase family)
MITLGYKLSSEEHSPLDLVRCAQMAQDSGFGFALISDHYHPWIDKQGQSPFVWAVIGAIAQATQRLTLGTAVTCPTTRLHPAIVAQAAATAAALMPGRFFLGVGTGENLNEHVVGQGWPGDGLIGTDPDPALLAAFDEAGGAGKPRYAELTVCYARDESTARRVAREHWPTSAMESSLSWELPLPAHFEAVAELVTEEQVAESITCGPDPARHLAAIRKYADAGYDHICVHQVGKEQKGFFELYADAILPQLRTLRAPRGKRRGEARRRRKS